MHAALGFAVAVTPLVVAPGASLAMLTTNVAAVGARGAPPVVVGTAGGILTHAALAGASTGVLGAPGPALATSYTVTVLNPKAATVYLALAPAFVETGVPVLGRLLLLGGVHALLVAVWLGVCTGLLQRARSRPALRGLGPWAMRVGALVLVLVAARALLTR